MHLECLANEAAVSRRCADLFGEVLRERPDAVLLLPAVTVIGHVAWLAVSLAG